jgi:hypothetical protein
VKGSKVSSSDEIGEVKNCKREAPYLPEETPRQVLLGLRISNLNSNQHQPWEPQVELDLDAVDLRLQS